MGLALHPLLLPSQCIYIRSMLRSFSEQGARSLSVKEVVSGRVSGHVVSDFCRIGADK